MKNKIICAALAVLMLLSLVSCGVRVEKVHSKPSIVTTNFAMFDFARAVAGNCADVMMLLTPGNESHDFEATLTDIAAISNADLFVYVGGESEDWVYDVFDSLYPAAPTDDLPLCTFCALDAVETYDEEIVEGMAPTDEENEETAPDEHVWTSLTNAMSLVASLADKLSEIDGDNAETYRANADKYIAQLDAVKDDLTEVVTNAKRHTIVVADRFPFRYLAEEFALEYYAAFSGCTSATEPPLSTVNFLTEKVKSENIPAIFVIEFSDGKTAKAVADECGCEILTLHSAHNVSLEDYRAGVTYADIMRRNLDALKIALK